MVPAIAAIAAIAFITSVGSGIRSGDPSVNRDQKRSGASAWRAAPVALAILGCVALLAAPAGAGGKRDIPNFKLKNLAGKEVRLDALRAQGPVLIDFWATWCKPCLRELAHLDKLRAKYEKQGLVVVAVSIDQTRSQAKVKAYIKTHKYGFQVLLDSNQRVLRLLQGVTVPYLLLVSPAGERLYVHSGYRAGDENELDEQIAAVMADYAVEGEDENAGAPAEVDPGER